MVEFSGLHWTESFGTWFTVGGGNANWTVTGTNSLGNDANSFGFRLDGSTFVAGTNEANWDGSNAPTQGGVVDIAFDLINMKAWARFNGGNWNNDVIANQNPATNTGGYSISGITGPFYAGGSAVGVGDTITANFGEQSFTYALPSGFTAWDTPLAAIQGTATIKPF